MKKRKLRYNKIILGIIIVYIIYNTINLIAKKNIDTIVLENQLIEESLQKKTLFIRDEYLLTSNMSGNIKYHKKEGEKVTKNDSIAYIFNDNIEESTLNDFENLKKDINNIKDGNTAIVKDDIDKINKNIKDISYNIQKQLLSDDININKDIKELEKLLKDKTYILNSDLNSKSLKNKEIEEKEVSNLINKNKETFSSKSAGVVSYKFDNNETKFNLENLDEIKSKDIENIENNYETINKKDKVKKGEPIVRVVNNLKQYAAISCNEKEAKNFKEGQRIILSNDIEKINTNVYDIYKDEKNYVIILEISEQNIEIYDTRVEEFDIIYESIEGLKIPKESIVTVNGKKGVYAISEIGDSEFVELKGNLYESEEYIIIDYYQNDVEGIKSIGIYDEIIKTPKK